MLSEDPAQWTCVGGRHDLQELYGYGDIREALRDVNCDLILVLFPLNVVPIDVPIEMKDRLRTHQEYEPDYSTSFRAVSSNSTRFRSNTPTDPRLATSGMPAIRSKIGHQPGAQSTLLRTKSLFL